METTWIIFELGRDYGRIDRASGAEYGAGISRLNMPAAIAGYEIGWAEQEWDERLSDALDSPTTDDEAQWELAREYADLVG